MRRFIVFLHTCLLVGCGSSSFLDEQEPVDVLPQISKLATPPNSLSATIGEHRGIVLVSARIDSVGNATNVSVDASDHEILESAAIDAVRGSVFSPALRNEKRVATWVLIPIRFVDLTTSNVKSVKMQFDDVLDRENTRRFTAPEVVKQVTPDYPKQALRMGTEGQVVVKLQVDRTGRVTHGEVMKSSDEIFEQPALIAARQFVFKPALFDGRSIPVTVAFPFRFQIASPPNPVLQLPNEQR